MSIAGLLVAFVAALYWYAWRPLPQTSGNLDAPIAQKATIVRDDLGVPHIDAASWEDAIFLQGFVTAQDRMWQLDTLRRLPAGELSEVIGTSTLETDRESRRLQLSRLAETQERQLAPDARKIYSLYARGVNYYLETHRGRLPLEFSILGYDPRPWRVRDSLLVALQMYRTLSQSWQDEIRHHHLMSANAEKAAYLFAGRWGPDALPGSNAWAISGQHTATGKPILANDPHLEYSLPSIWYLIHLRAPGLDVTGSSIPGIPAVLIGHNQRIAWGMTNLGFDSQDLHREQINMATGQYIVQGALRQARPDREPIPVKDQRPSESAVWRTEHGPVFLSDRQQSYALRWTATEFPDVHFPFLDLNRARNWQEFNAALEKYEGPSQNAIYADVDGNIGYHAIGLLPIRKGCDGSVPADACEWVGKIPYNDLPSAYNPPSGVLVSSNQNPFPKNYPHPVNGIFAPSYRARGILARLRSKAKWNPAEMLDIQKDVHSTFGVFLAKQIVQAFDKKPSSNPQVREAVDVLRKWNGQMEILEPAPMVISVLQPALQKAVAQHIYPKASDDDSAAVTSAALERLFTDRPSGWFPDYDQVLLQALTTGIAAGQRFQGSKIEAWDYGQWMALTMRNPVAGQLPLIGSYFNVGPVPMSGSPTSVKQYTRRLGPSMRMVVDLSNLDNSQTNIALGQSGHPLSSHYRDQWNAYYAGTSFPMQFSKVTRDSVLTVTPK